MNRHYFLAFRPGAKAGREHSARTQTGIQPYSGPWTRNEVQHLLKRTMFGSAKEDIDYFSARSLAESVQELINPTAPLPAPPVNDYNNTTLTDPVVKPGETWVNNPTTDGTLNSVRRASFKKWWTGLMIRQDRSIREKMTLFWANHFGTEMNEIGNAHYIYRHHALLRQYATHNFKQLIRDVTVDTGMLRYLNGYLNTATAPDETYARELQELFTLGKGPAVQYTEDDVRHAARVLTGWRINGTTFTTTFDPSKHDTTSKSFSSFYGGKVIGGRSGTAGAAETNELIDMIFTKEEVARFICRKLYRWFVYYKIDDTAEANVIQPLANIFIRNNYEIKPVLSALFQSEHFFDIQNQGCLIKSPADHVIGCMREFKVNFPAATDFADAYGMWQYIRGWMTSTGQDIGDPPDVSGWPAYYQAPQFHEIWINSDTLPKRSRFTDTMISTGFSRNGKKIIIDAVAFAKTLSNPRDPNSLLDEILRIIYRVPLSAAIRQSIKQQILLSNQSSDFYWTDAWNTYLASPDMANYTIVNSRLKALLQYFMNLPEYHLS